LGLGYRHRIRVRVRFKVILSVSVNDNNKDAGELTDLLKYGRDHKKSPHYRIASTQKSLPGRQFTCKNPPRPGGCRAGRISAGKLSAKGDFSGEGEDPIMGHRRRQPARIRSSSSTALRYAVECAPRRIVRRIMQCIEMSLSLSPGSLDYHRRKRDIRLFFP